MSRLKQRWPLEVEAGLEQNIQTALAENQRTEPTLKRNEFLCRLIRRGLSSQAEAPVWKFTCVDNLTMAQFRGDVNKMERFFDRVRSAIMNCNRSVDRDDPESVKRFEDDDRKTKEFLNECEKLLKMARDHAWHLRGFPTKDAEYLRLHAATWTRKLADVQAVIFKLEQEGKSGALSLEKEEKLKSSRNEIKLYSAFFKVLEFAVLEDKKHVG